MGQDTRGRILDATFQRVADVGLAGLTLEDVATVAGVSRQTLYRHFGSRENLIEALVLREEQWFIDRVVSAADRHASAEAALSAAVVEALQASTDHPLLRRLLDTEPGEILPMLVLGRGPVISAARPVVARILAERLAIPPEEAEAIAELCARLMVSFVLDPGHEGPETVGQRIAAMVLYGLADDVVRPRA